MNIIQNSLEAMPQGGKIVLSAQVIPSDNLVVITITDTGLGMAPDLVEKVCDPFFSTKTREGLRGLGMAIVRDIMKAHRGKVEIKSSPGQGTSVILYFPGIKNVEYFSDKLS